jgi:hypothetical protein
MRNFRFFFILIMLLLLLAGCSKPVDQPVATSAAPPAETSLPTATMILPAQPTLASPASTPAKGTIDTLIEGTMALRSVKLNLETTRPDGQATSLAGEIDASGAQHLVKVYPQPDSTLFPVGSGNPPSTAEIYVLTEGAYTPDENGALHLAEAADVVDYLQSSLLGPDGPGFWLKILPAGSLSPAGSEVLNGFQSMKYALSACIGDGTISGSMWIEPSLQALIGAELSIPASLAGPEASGDLNIRFHVAQADVAPIQPAVAAKISTEPETEATVEPAEAAAPTDPSAAGLPPDVPLYSDAKLLVVEPGTIVYQPGADVATVKQFYSDRLISSGWETDGDPIEAGGAFFMSWVKGDLTIQINLQPNAPAGSLVVLGCDGCAQ